MECSKVVLVLALAVICCVLSVNGQCPTCPNNWDPVCGSVRHSNGWEQRCTFRNFCQLRRHRCTSRQPWGAVPGACGPVCRFSG